MPLPRICYRFGLSPRTTMVNVVQSGPETIQPDFSHALQRCFLGGVMEGGSISSCQCFNFKSNFLKLGIATSIMKSFCEHFCPRLSVNCFYRRNVCSKLSAWSWTNAIANQPSDWGTGPRILSAQLTKAMYRTLKKCNKKIITIIFNTSIVHFNIDIWSNAHTQQWDLFRAKFMLPTVRTILFTVICYVWYKQFSMAKNKQEIKKKINLEEGSAVIQHGDQNFQSVIFSWPHAINRWLRRVRVTGK